MADLYASITVTNGKATVDGQEVTTATIGTVVTITADTPTTSYTFKKWTVKSGSVQLQNETSTQTSFVMPNSSVEIVAEYNHTHVMGNWTSNDDGTHTKACQYCTYTQTENCSLNSVVTNPTCTAQGYTTHSCKVCTYSYTDSYTDPTGHQHKKLVNAKDSTCAEEGYTGDVICEDCKTVLEKGTVIEKKPHHFVDGVCTECGAKDPNYNPPQPEPEKKDDNKTSPDTGMEATAWASLLALGLGVATVTIASRKKREE